MSAHCGTRRPWTVSEVSARWLLVAALVVGGVIGALTVEAVR